MNLAELLSRAWLAIAMRGCLCWLFVAGLGLPATARAQGAVDPRRGVVAVDQLLRGLGAVKRVLVIGAHPDDEDTSLLALMVRGAGADAAYLSLNRGEGGQNLIGPELGVGLGLLRTEELLAARRLDGADQFFTRAYDFGYSKSADETFQFWPRDSLLADVVYVVRRYRPQVIVSIFSGTRRDGHGQHQVAGMLAREAFEAAGDSTRFPQQISGGLHPWTPLKLYRSTRFDTAAATLEVETGALDMMLGRSYHQIAMASRSQHRSQDMGRVETLGPQSTTLQLLESRVSEYAEEPESGLFDGVDTTLVGMLSSISRRPLREKLAELLVGYRSDLRRASDALGRDRGASVVSHLGLALAKLRGGIELTETTGAEAEDLHFVLTGLEAKLTDALAQAAGVIVDAFGDDDLLVPGQDVQVDVQIWNGGAERIDLLSLSLHTPAGWLAEPLDSALAMLPPGSLLRRGFRMTVPGDAEPTRPYYLRLPRTGAVYTWPQDASERALPFGAPILEARVGLKVGGQVVESRAEVVFRFADQALGEVRRPLFVVPAIGVSAAPRTSVWPLGRQGSVTLSASLLAESPEGSRGRVWVEAPQGWVATPAEAPYELAGPGRATVVDFQLRASSDLSAGNHRFRVVAETEQGRRYSLGYAPIDYSHIRRNVLFTEAKTAIEAFELSADTSTRVAYVPGAGDAVADAIEVMGITVDMLDGRAVASGDLSAYDVIVLGVRAYETNQSLVASNDRLLEWVRAGGTLIVQYQQYGYFRGDFAPFPLSARFPHDRVSDEAAPIRVLLPKHTALNHPNKIGPGDFAGWVQERGLYFPHRWDDHYQALLETADPGEAPKRGALLVAAYGDGLYVYTGLSFFRQLPAGVPGAYRLLANLLSLER